MERASVALACLAVTQSCSYCARLKSSPSTSSASVAFLNASSAPIAWFLSGCSLSLSRLVTLRSWSAEKESRGMPTVS